jgi:hypothetical protein
LFGLVLFVVAFPILFWNEGRAVRTARSLEEGAGVVVSVPAETVDAGKEGKLVHLTGQATTTDTLTDNEFGVHANAIKLLRKVEMYQWEEEKKSETKKKLGGGEETVTTYTYKKDWSDHPIDSSDFKEPRGHENPGAFEFEAANHVARKVTLGAFTLSDAIVQKLDNAEPLAVDAATLPAPVKSRAKASGSGYYLGEDPASPTIGDLKVAFEVVKPATISVVARQVKDTFESYQAQAGDAILLVKYGTLSAEAMFQAAQRENAILTWILRGIGWFMMFLGLVMIFRPIAVFGDVIPLVGTMLGAGIGVFAGLTSIVLSLVTIAIAWLFFRPLLAIGLLVLAVGGLAALIMLGLKRKRAAGAAAGAPPAVRRGAA